MFKPNLGRSVTSRNESHRFKLHVNNRILNNVLFCTISPDDNHNVAKEKPQKKRRRIISSSSESGGDENAERKSTKDEAQ